MAWLEVSPTGVYRVVFRIEGQRFSKSLRTRDVREADARLYCFEENMRLVESGRLEVPDGADLATYLLSDGKLTGQRSPRKQRSPRTLKQFQSSFLESIPEGSLEESTVRCIAVHFRHLSRHLGPRFLLSDLGLEDLQRYVDLRSKESGRNGKTLSSTTIKKEISTLRTMWTWACDAGHLQRPLSLKGIRYPKSEEKPPFQTLSEIERRIAANHLTPQQERELWSCLFFTTSETEELLDHVEETQRHGFIYPMFVFAAHTGARRSEIIRSELSDIDLAGKMVTIRERKRVRGRLTTRSVPMSRRLTRAMTVWLESHPGGAMTFTVGPTQIAHSMKSRTTPVSLTRDEAHDHFRRALQGTRWANARGWHVFRHSFCSNCAAKGIDQRLINAWVGHQTEEMVRRYRHLIPSQQQQAIKTVFGTQ